MIARDVFRIEPVEAALRVVRSLLLRHQQGKAVTLRQRRPAGAEIVTSGGLAAAMQNDDQRGRGLQSGAGTNDSIRRSPGLLPKPVISVSGLWAAGVSPRAKSPKAIDLVQLRQASQEFDIFDQRHGSSSVRDLTTPPKTDSCCTAK